MRNDDIKRILVYRCGQLGDTLVALPSMWVVRENFPDAELTLLHDNHGGKRYVSARSILERTGIFDEFVDYDPAIFSRAMPSNIWRTFELLLRLRKGRYDSMVYLAPSKRQGSTVARDTLFFSFLVGIPRIIGKRDFPILPVKEEGKPLPELQAEVDLLLNVSGHQVCGFLRQAVREWI